MRTSILTSGGMRCSAGSIVLTYTIDLPKSILAENPSVVVDAIEQHPGKFAGFSFDRHSVVVAGVCMSD